MASRSGTAAAQKPSTSQAGASQQRSRGQTRGTATRASGRTTGYTEDSQRTATGSRRPTTTAGEPTSLFDGNKQTKGGEEGGEGVKADDIWNKFVSDDQNVVRAPTADSNVSGSTRSSQRTGYSQVTGSQGSQRPSQIDEEDEEEEEEEEESDDDRTIYSDYYLPPEYIREEGTPGPRAEIVDSHEACSCFPNRSNKFIGSMLYDKITCQHTGLTGHTQPGVFKFNPYWNENMEEPRRLRKRDMRVARSKYVFGYPKPKFELVSESEEETDEYDEDDDDNETVDQVEISGKAETPKTAKTTKTQEEDDDEDDYDSEYDSEEYDSEDEEDDEEDEDFIPYKLPEIGYPKTPSLPPSSQSFRSRYSDFTEYSESVPESLPSLPASRQRTAQTRTGVTQRTQRTQFTLPSRRDETKRSTRTAKSNKTEKSGKKSAKKPESVDSGYDDESSRRTTASRQSLPVGPVIGTTRTFQGKYYDPVTKQVMLYDIGTRPGRRIPDGNLEPLYKPTTANNMTPKTSNKNETSLKPGTKGSKRSTTSQESHHSVPKAAVLGAVFISNLLSKNKGRKETVEAGYSDEDENS